MTQIRDLSHLEELARRAAPEKLHLDLRLRSGTTHHKVVWLHPRTGRMLTRTPFGNPMLVEQSFLPEFIQRGQLYEATR
jgi:hypothetical protein